MLSFVALSSTYSAELVVKTLERLRSKLLLALIASLLPPIPMPDPKMLPVPPVTPTPIASALPIGLEARLGLM